MKNRRLLAIPAMALAFVLSACSFGGKEPVEQVIVEEEATPTPEPVETPEPTEEPEPEVWEPTYTSADGSISIDYPDESWSNKTDANGLVSIESESGRIVVIHGDAEDKETLVLPDSEDMAMTLERALPLEDSEFEISEYSNSDESGANVIYYVVKYNDTEKTEGVAQRVHKYISNDTEYYEITGETKAADDAALTAIRTSIDSFRILNDSALKGAATGASAATAAEGTEAAASEGAEGGEAVDAEPAGESAGTGSSGYTDEQLADSSVTRTIYNNETGSPIVVSNNGDGTWSDRFGNSYRFDSNDESIVYDQNDVDFYYHGEAGDVAYMPITYEE